jgi:hypothetical protein
MNSEMKRINEKYRWYLCLEQSPLVWSCVSADAEKALEPENLFRDGKGSKAVAVNRFIPKIFDFFYLHQAMHPRVKMSL